MPFVSHAEKDKVKRGSISGGQMEVGMQLLLVFQGGLLSVRVLGLDTMHLFRFQRSFGDHGLRRHAEIAVGMSGLHVALIAEEQLYLVPRKLRPERIAD